MRKFTLPIVPERNAVSTEAKKARQKLLGITEDNVRELFCYMSIGSLVAMSNILLDIAESKAAAEISKQRRSNPKLSKSVARKPSRSKGGAE